MARQITLRYAANCSDCGAFLAVGQKAKYYGRGKVYGTECHDRDGPKEGFDRTTQANDSRRSPRALTDHETETWSPGRIASHYDPTGAYSPDGTFLGRSGGRCEDAPCCGCCP